MKASSNIYFYNKLSTTGHYKLYPFYKSDTPLLPNCPLPPPKTDAVLKFSLVKFFCGLFNDISFIAVVKARF